MKAPMYSTEGELYDPRSRSSGPTVTSHTLVLQVASSSDASSMSGVSTPPSSNQSCTQVSKDYNQHSSLTKPVLHPCEHRSLSIRPYEQPVQKPVHGSPGFPR